MALNDRFAGRNTTSVAVNNITNVAQYVTFPALDPTVEANRTPGGQAKLSSHAEVEVEALAGNGDPVHVRTDGNAADANGLSISPGAKHIFYNVMRMSLFAVNGAQGVMIRCK